MTLNTHRIMNTVFISFSCSTEDFTQGTSHRKFEGFHDEKYFLNYSPVEQVILNYYHRISIKNHPNLSIVAISKHPTSSHVDVIEYVYFGKVACFHDIYYNSCRNGYYNSLY